MKNLPSAPHYFLLICILTITVLSTFILTQNQNTSRIIIKKCDDFQISGDGSAKNWELTDWIQLTKRTDGKAQDTAVKMLYSDNGIYFLFNCRDDKLTASMTEDFLDIWNEDVVEVFLWPDEDYPAYFEYELSPLNHELSLLIPNLKGKFLSWRPCGIMKVKEKSGTPQLYRVAKK